MKSILKLISLACFQSSEAAGDEIYLVFNGKKIWPLDEKFKSLKSEERLEVNLEFDIIQPKQFVRIELWEHDLFFDDYLGSFEFSIDNCGDSFDTDLKKIKPDSIHKYGLTWEARANRKKRQLASPITGKR